MKKKIIFYLENTEKNLVITSDFSEEELNDLPKTINKLLSMPNIASFMTAKDIVYCRSDKITAIHIVSLDESDNRKIFNNESEHKEDKSFQNSFDILSTININETKEEQTNLIDKPYENIEENEIDENKIETKSNYIEIDLTDEEKKEINNIEID